jgi:hypothetical protein
MCLLALILFVVGVITGARESIAQEPVIEEEALAILKRSAEFVSQIKQFHVVAEIGFDVVQESGQKIEFGGSRSVTIRRPDHARFEFVSRDGASGTVIIDSTNLSVFSKDENVYAQVAHPGGIDQAVRYLSDTLDVPMPLREFFVSDASDALTDGIESAQYVGESVLAGVPADHLAFMNDEVDYQVWIAKGDKPLPRRVVITYRLAQGHPQFWAQFLSWDLSPEVPDSLFDFAPPKDAERITFLSTISPKELKGAEQ